MMEDLQAWLQRSEGPLGYVVIGLATLIEYVFPPFPGDSVSLFGVFLAVAAGYRIPGVYAALNVGALIGGMSAYGFGRWLGAREGRMPRFLRGPKAQAALDRVLARFATHGAAYLAINRFIPALRAFFFVAAGMARLPAWKVALWGGVSACAWNALLLGLGWLAGSNYDRLAGWMQAYSYVALGVVVIVIAIVWWRRRAPRGER